jgi:hypothetical protein
LKGSVIGEVWTCATDSASVTTIYAKPRFHFNPKFNQ